MKTNRVLSTVLFVLSAAVFQQCEEKTETGPKQGDELRANAEAGDPNAQYQLGLRYYNGEGLGKDLTEAAKCFRKSAEQGLAAAEGYLGRRSGRQWGERARAE